GVTRPSPLPAPTSSRPHRLPTPPRRPSPSRSPPSPTTTPCFTRSRIEAIVQPPEAALRQGCWQWGQTSWSAQPPGQTRRSAPTLAQLGPRPVVNQVGRPARFLAGQLRPREKRPDPARRPLPPP